MIDFGVSKPDLGTVGVWTRGAPRPDYAAEIERLGFGAVWVGGSPGADLEFVEPLLSATSTLQIATGVVNVWAADPKTVSTSFRRIEAVQPGRLLLGIGAGHPERAQDYKKPIAALTDYFEALDDGGVPVGRRVLAALGPRALGLSALRATGAHPYFTTPQHTRSARQTLGAEPFLAPEQKILLATDVAAARQAGRQALSNYLGLSNYVNNWKRMGFTDDDVQPPGSDRLVDALIAHGTAESVAGRVREHLDAGADHVAVQVMGGWKMLLPALGELAHALGLPACG